MPLEWVELAPFVASTFFAVGPALSERPWAEYTTWLTERQVDLISAGATPEQAKNLIPESACNQAKRAARLAALPESAALTALGVWLSFSGRWAVVSAAVLVASAYLLQKVRNPNRTVGRGRIALPLPSLLLVALNGVALVTAAAT